MSRVWSRVDRAERRLHDFTERWWWIAPLVVLFAVVAFEFK